VVSALSPEVRSYLDEVRVHLRLDPDTEKRIIRELYTDFQDRMTDLQGRGLARREAGITAVHELGRPRVIARRMYEAHSRGSYTEAALAALPHLILAILFAFHLWHDLILAPLAFASIAAVTVYGWWHGKPSWLYSWVGYSLLPLLIGGYAFRNTIAKSVTSLFWSEGSLPDVWLMMLALTFVLFSLWIIIRTTIRVVKRDWLLTSLMLVPLPVMGGWLFDPDGAGNLFQGHSALAQPLDGPMALALICLAATSAIFIRLRQRVLKFVALLAVGTLAMTTLVHYFSGRSDFFGLPAISLVLSAILLSPALLEAKVGHGEQSDEAWWESSSL